jgi:hypothetical protein
MGHTMPIHSPLIHAMEYMTVMTWPNGSTNLSDNDSHSTSGMGPFNGWGEGQYSLG